jgi:hypothetical protein
MLATVALLSFIIFHLYLCRDLNCKETDYPGAEKTLKNDPDAMDVGDLGDTAALLLTSAAWACGFGVVHYVLRLTSSMLLRNEDRKDQHEWANYVISCTQAAISGFAGAMGLLIEEPFATSFRRATR